MTKKTFLRIIILITFIKLLLMIFFSSDYQNRLFIPFVKHFVQNFDNPWEYFFKSHGTPEFPYNPLMLYILSFFYLPIKLFHVTNRLFVNFFFKIPLLLSDFLILYIFYKIFPKSKPKIILLYFLSPIILYATYVHSQLDIIPTALLFLAVYMLWKDKIYLSSFIFGLALSVKSHIFVALIFILIYVLKKYSLKESVLYALTSLTVFLFFIVPFLFSDGYYIMVLSNPKQQMIYDVFFNIKHYKIYLPIFAVLLLYYRFFSYKKVNFELLESYLAFSFSVFILLILPAPAWYLWMLPYMIIFHIRTSANNKDITNYFHILSFFYLIFYIFFYIPEHNDIIFVNKTVNFKINSNFYRNIAYTFLTSTLVGNIYLCYKHGIRRNRIYNKFKAIVLGISGNSGAGKSTLSNDIKDILKENVLQIEGDADHKWEREDENWKAITHLDPKANYLYKQYQDILDLKKGNPIFRREYDHKTGKFTEEKKYIPKDFIIISGLHTFYLPMMRNIVDIKVFLAPQENIRLFWKISREIKKRGYSKEKVIEQINTRKKDAKIFIQPQEKYADIIIKYFTEEHLNKIPQKLSDIYLKIVISTKYNLENFVFALTKEQIFCEWEYLDDFNSQEIVLKSPPSQTQIENVAYRLFKDIDNLVKIANNWKEGYRGFTQLLFVYIQLYKLIEELKEN